MARRYHNITVYSAGCRSSGGQTQLRHSTDTGSVSGQIPHTKSTQEQIQPIRELNDSVLELGDRVVHADRIAGE